MVYTVYKTTNTVNGKFYIGVHKTSDPDDDYLGSGTLLKRAIEKYGRECFRKEILSVFENPTEAFELEASLVDAAVVSLEECYNLKVGGKGGWDHLFVDGRLRYPSNREAQREAARITGKKTGPRNGRLNGPRNIRKAHERGLVPHDGMLGKTHRESTKALMSELARGTSNSQFGTMWITNGVDNVKIRKDSTIPNGWKKGRTLRRA